MGRLIVSEVIISPTRNRRDPLEAIRSEVEGLDFDFFVHVFRRHVVHVSEQRHELALQIVALATPKQAGILFTGRRATARRLGIRQLTVITHLGNAVGNVIDNIEPGDVLCFQEINGLALLLAEDCHQYTGTRNLLLARGLDMKNSAL